MSAPANKIWINNTVQDESQPVFAATDRGTLLGDGLFETLKILAGRPCYFDNHWARLSASAKELNLPIPFDHAIVLQGIVNLAGRNGITKGVARITLSRGPGPRGLMPSAKPNAVMMITTTSGLPHYDALPVLGLSRIRRNLWSASSCHKTLSYIDNIAARWQQVSAVKYDEVVMLNTDGNIASASVANLFWWDEKALYTPSPDCAILRGTMRARVLKQAQLLGLNIRQDHYSPTAILEAKGAFMTNALLGIQKLAGLDFGPMGTVDFMADAVPPFMVPLLSALGADADKTSPPV